MNTTQCFAQRDNSIWCQVLKGMKVPDDCQHCKFKKPERDVTNGRRYPPMVKVDGYVPKYASNDAEDDE